MKKRITFSAIVAFAALTVPTGTFAQEDSILVDPVTPDTVIVREREVIREEPAIVTQTVAVPEETPRAERPPLRVGEFGIRYMPVFSSLALRTYNGETIQGDITLSHGYGAMVGLNLSRHVGLQAEVNYYEITQKYKDRELDREVGVSYLNIPVLLTLNTDKTMPVNLKVEAGPQFGINIGSSIKTTSTGRDTEQLTATVGANSSDVGLAYGAGLEFALNRLHTVRLDLGFRGFYGLVDMSSGESSGDTYNVLVRASRKTLGGYGGLTFCF